MHLRPRVPETRALLSCATPRGLIRLPWVLLLLRTAEDLHPIPSREPVVFETRPARWSG